MELREMSVIVSPDEAMARAKLLREAEYVALRATLMSDVERQLAGRATPACRAEVLLGSSVHADRLIGEFRDAGWIVERKDTSMGWVVLGLSVPEGEG